MPSPAYARIRDTLKARILSGELPKGTRLPTAPALADAEGVHRLTALRAYRELAALGYLEMVQGRGTSVSRTLPEAFLEAASSTRSALPPPRALLKTLETRARRLAPPPGKNVAAAKVRIFLEQGAVDPRLFPLTTWRRLYARRLRKPDPLAMQFVNPQGLSILRRAICERVLPARGLHATPKEVLVLSGTLQALRLGLDLLAPPGGVLALEEPGIGVFREAGRDAGLRVRPLPMDREGATPEGILKALPNRRTSVLLLTPTHQYPTGATMGAARRQAVLEAAARRPAWILEDDYDHEFHYDSPPPPSLGSLDPSGRVIHLGTFSKALFPGIRISFLAGPKALVAALAERKNAMDGHVPGLAQLVLADFLDSGAYDAHLRRMRRIYQRRRDAMVRALRTHLPDFAFEPPAGGMRVWVRTPDGVDVERLSARLAERGILVGTGTRCFTGRPPAGFLHLGFTGADEAGIEEGILAIRDEAAALR